MAVQYYEIRVKGKLVGSYWSRWFEGLTVYPAGEGETVIVGPVTDQAALHGLLGKVRDLGLPLVAVKATTSEGKLRRARRGRPVSPHPDYARRSTFPGRAPVCSPPAITGTPFTNTCSTPFT